MSRTVQLFLLELALLELACILGIILVAVGWLAGWVLWMIWRLFYLAWAGEPEESYDIDVWPIGPGESRPRPDMHAEDAPSEP